MSEINVTFGDSNSEPESPPSQPNFFARLILGILITLVIMSISALAWGGLAYFTQKVYIYVAVIIGLAVSYGLSYPFQRVSIPLLLLLVVPTLALTIVTVLAGDIFYYTLMVADGQQLGYDQAFLAVIQDIQLFLSGGDTLQSVVIACVGSLLGVFNLGRS